VHGTNIKTTTTTITKTILFFHGLFDFLKENSRAS